MQLLDLPLELFKRVVTALARVAPFHELVRLRAVCRAFAGDIDNELLANTSVADFHSRTHQHQSTPWRQDIRAAILHTLLPLGTLGFGKDDDSNSLSALSPHIKGYLLSNIKTYLLNHIEDRETIVSGLPSFINKVNNKLLEFPTVNRNRSVLRKSYLNALIRSLVLTNKVAPRTMFDVNPVTLDSVFVAIFRQGSHSIAEREWDHLNSVQENVNGILSAAAAVGSLEATRHYISQSAEIIDWFPIYFAGFGNPITAAVCSGNMKVLEFLLIEVNNELTKRRFARIQHGRTTCCGPLTETITSAIKFAVRTGQLKAVVTLFNFLPRCRVEIPTHMKSPSQYLADAMRWGQVDIFTWLMDQWNPVTTELPYWNVLTAGLRLAVKYGHTNIVRYIFDKGLMYPHDADVNTVLIAATHGHRAIIQLALDRGVELTMQDLIAALNGSLPLLITQYFLLHNVLLKSVTKEEGGRTITTSIVPIVEAICQESINISFGDYNAVQGKEKVLALILLAFEMRRQIPELTLDNCVELKKVFDRLVKVCLILPKGSVPYLEMAEDVHSWMEWRDGREWEKCEV
ncbi:hypothetical protein BKA58DRAFT_469003 [Alternaria rosae]|uniref:uncharacterized protein n=1 Tax=Alternaria rosae TaxID=1187941 RepID=UPI001E8CD761|nr:uncharacterized protein BKA58DRAFT_469003 [Alternaria rosae]KAH6873367.1 hypothetical protein BKA58DRAFT_469003 [Alternaria rosae]